MSLRTMTQMGYGRLVTIDKTSTPDKDGDSDIYSGPCRVWFLMVDNTLNAAEGEYLKIYNSTAPTYGTTEPEFVFPIKQGAVTPVVLDMAEGHRFSTGLSLACAQEAGADCTTSPTATVTVTISGR